MIILEVHRFCVCRRKYIHLTGRGYVWHRIVHTQSAERSFYWVPWKALRVSQPCLFSPPFCHIFYCLMLIMTMYNSVAASFASSSSRKRLRSCISDKDGGSSQSKKRMKISEAEESRTSTRLDTIFQIYTARKANFWTAIALESRVAPLSGKTTVNLRYKVWEFLRIAHPISRHSLYPIFPQFSMYSSGESYL